MDEGDLQPGKEESPGKSTGVELGKPRARRGRRERKAALNIVGQRRLRVDNDRTMAAIHRQALSANKGCEKLRSEILKRW